MVRINYSDQEVIKGVKSIFLAGPTPRQKGVRSWRLDAIDLLNELGFNGIVYVPEYSSWKPKEDYVDQAMWEREALTESTVILFWIPRDLNELPAFTTNVEFGYWLHSGKVVYGRPDEARKMKYLDWLYFEDTTKKPFNNLPELLCEAMFMADEMFDKKEQVLLPLVDRNILKKVHDK